MKKQLTKIKENYCFWYFLSVIMSGVIVYVLVLFWGDKMQDWMYLRHQYVMPNWMLVAGIVYVVMWYSINSLLFLIRKYLKP